MRRRLATLMPSRMIGATPEQQNCWRIFWVPSKTGAIPLTPWSGRQAPTGGVMVRKLFLHPMAATLVFSRRNRNTSEPGMNENFTVKNIPAAFSPDANNSPPRYNLPENVEYCRTCVISNQRPSSSVEFKTRSDSPKTTIHFDDEGVCDACRFAEHKHNEIDWDSARGGTEGAVRSIPPDRRRL